jgi:Flp pilus assembly protein TadD
MALAIWHEQQGDLEAAFASIGRAAALADQSTQAVALQGAMLASHGRHEEAREVLYGLQVQSQARYVPFTSLAAVQAALGERDAALASLELAYDCNDTRLLHLRDDSRWVSLRQEARFRNLVTRMKLSGLPTGVAPP